MAIPEDVQKREIIKQYVQEALAEKRVQALSKTREKETYDAVKESEDSLGVTLPEFKEIVNAAYEYEKQQAKLDKIQSGLDGVELLKL